MYPPPRPSRKLAITSWVRLGVRDACEMGLQLAHLTSSSGILARNSGSAFWPGILARHSGPAFWPGILARTKSTLKPHPGRAALHHVHRHHLSPQLAVLLHAGQCDLRVDVAAGDVGVEDDDLVILEQHLKI